MPVFEYIALDGGGKKTSGAREFGSEPELSVALRRDGLFLIRATSAAATKAVAPNRALPPKVLSDFTERLEILVKAGVPLVESLNQIASETDHAGAAAVIEALADAVAEGRPFSEAIQAFPNVFDASYRAVISAGEASGTLDEVLATLATKLIQSTEARKKLKSSLMQPAILLVALVGLFFLIVLYLIPKFAGIFAKTGIKPPSTTQAVLDLKDFLSANWAILVVGLVVTIVGFRFGMRLQKFRAAVQRCVFALPVAGKLITMTEARTFVHIVGLLNRHGVTFTRSLGIARDAAATEKMRAAIDRVLTDVTQGCGLAESVQATGAFPPLVVQMVQVGQKTGELDEALGRVENYLDREIPRLINGLLATVNPAITLISGVAVGFAIFSVIQPMFAVMKAMKG